MAVGAAAPAAWTEFAEASSRGETGLGFWDRLCGRDSSFSIGVVRGETLGRDLYDEAAAMVESGDKSFASGFVIFNGPRDKSAMSGLRSGEYVEQQLACCNDRLRQE